jgi:hypothetical protein
MSANLAGENGMKKRKTEGTKALAKSRQVGMDYAALVAAIEQTHQTA